VWIYQNHDFFSSVVMYLGNPHRNNKKSRNDVDFFFERIGLDDLRPSDFFVMGKNWLSTFVMVIFVQGFVCVFFFQSLWHRWTSALWAFCSWELRNSYTRAWIDFDYYWLLNACPLWWKWWESGLDEYNSSKCQRFCLIVRANRTQHNNNKSVFFSQILVWINPKYKQQIFSGFSYIKQNEQIFFSYTLEAIKWKQTGFKRSC
jgi:hypothetical protein